MRRYLIGVIMLALIATGGVAAATRTGTPDITGFITDEHGRALILHGFNTASSAKSTPDAHPDFTEADLDRELRDMGTNFVRYLIQWRAVEPEPGVYDDDYLREVSQRVQWYAERGYHVMLDMHQDLYGGHITPEGDAGNGAPHWATIMDGLPVESQDQWEMYYLEPGVIRAFDNFWNTTGRHPELMEHYAAAWGHVAEYFADEPAVLGYDLMNEPWGGTLQGAAFETGPLATLYQSSIDRIRQHDPDSWIFVEPQAVGINWGLPSSLPRLDDPRDGDARIGYAPHLYPLPLDLGGRYDTDGDLIDTTMNWWLDNIQRTAQRLDAPILLGEFGYDATLPGTLDYIEATIRLTDENLMGWAYWSRDPGGWGPYTGDGVAQPLTSVLDRAYPRAVAGTPTLIDYQPDRLAVSFIGSPEVVAPTEIYLPTEFGSRPSASCGDCAVEWDDQRRILSVTTPAVATEQHIVVTR
ncbi:endoglycosylceramidase [Stackebrandtia endophytica]|uniref:Endoglycosylceramidase n=1 Tax=Stackebrandtia endophytica TaxID=1496996 RepID=A0A543B010_9ACTN|nr:cellulase family glycosylhydrolase [Stackebrandtia endophytica]TQL78175.1 endoglycosylceramidase [Stackebrandtia endophytica]